MENVAHIVKRGKARQDARPVRITLDVLESFGRVPLTTAAKTLGVSATALKGACRKLGIERWPYWAGRGMVTQPSAPLVPTFDSKKVRVCDAATQTELSFNAIELCEAPALVDAEDAYLCFVPNVWS